MHAHDTGRTRVNPIRVPVTKLHPATKQLDGRMQPQVLPSSLTIVPVYMASGHPAKTLAMPSSSTLPYAAKQLDDTSINSRTQSFTQQLNASSPQPEPKTKQSHHSNCQLDATNSQDDTRRLLPQPPDSMTTQILAITEPNNCESVPPST